VAVGRRSVRAVGLAVMGVAITALTGALASAGPATAAPSSGAGLVAIANSVTPATDALTGGYGSSAMQVEVALAPRDPAGLNSTLSALYDKGSPSYHRWLAPGQFAARFAPAAGARNAVAGFLRARGLAVEASTSPFLVRATGSSARVSAAFHTTLSTYKNPRGISYFANSTPVEVPGSVAGDVLGVIGLTNTVRERDGVVRIDNVMVPKAKAATSSGSASCETSYPTRQQLFNMFVAGVSFAYGYGGGPGCSGLTPSQTNSIYSAPTGGSRDQGAGVDLAVFELSAYQESDIDTWAQTFYGHGYSPPLANINVDGGPLNPVCPAGDTCPSQDNSYAGDIEVVADIEESLAISPDADNILVYNAPNDQTGQTALDEYTAIANQDTADTISSSWGVCEHDVTAAYVQAENVVFEQMAAQGQSMFGAAGDTGAFDCIRSDGTTTVNVEDPPSQPWVTSVGGTSFQTFNPGTDPSPSYPEGVETVWNVNSLCSNAPASSALDGETGFYWCATTGATGGGSSQYWSMPAYQRGPGIINSNTTYGNGSTHCSLAAQGSPCREVPDISADADQFTPYAEYCTGGAATPNSVCATLGNIEAVPGWFGIGGTSLSSPLWSAIIADRDGHQGQRSGNANPLLYALYNIAPGLYFHDITGIGQATTNNGLFPATPGYDLVSGIGTPKMAAIITGSA
jgi:subtilase family serine protease